MAHVQPTILVVDDQDSVRKAMCELYERAGLRVIGSAAEGVEAIEKCRDLKPDLISLDIIMPVMDGIECYKTIHKEKLLPNADEEALLAAYKKLSPRIFFVSYLASDQRVIDAYKEVIPAAAFISKSLAPNEILQRIGSLLNLHLNTVQDIPISPGSASQDSPSL